MTYDGNHGVVIQCSSSGPVAAGPKATADQVDHMGEASLREILEQLRATRQRIEENRSQLVEPELALEEVDDIVDLIQQERPDRRRVMVKVDRLVTRLSGVGGIARNAWGLSQLINQFAR
ncbi:hypothetical protein [Micromonospora sp. B006]|uniref:hypothetical protein n=1 Tax=Micromonospora sp. B006 TaxID=2201999 RepID=UPI000E300163|nr:hypothetical protein [Micromonospora sp. B006]AXO35794.1 hypothetical protein MicB006_3515 [Micromonospora sp. B006]